LLREKGEEHRRERDGREREHGREKGKAREMDGCGFSLFASPFSSCPGGVFWSNTKIQVLQVGPRRLHT